MILVHKLHVKIGGNKLKASRDSFNLAFSLVTIMIKSDASRFILLSVLLGLTLGYAQGNRTLHSHPFESK
jgi:hypothetical protein